mgnify:FL=1
MNTPRPTRADARRNRDAIIAAARAAFDNDEQLRFDDYAARAGVGVGTLYRHFPTRQALAAAVYEGEVMALCDKARDAARPAGENLAAFLHAFVEFLVAHAGLARALTSIVDPELQVEGGIRLESTVWDLLAAAESEGFIRKNVSAGAVMIVLHGIGSSSDRPDWASESRAAVELLLDALISASEAPPR